MQAEACAWASAFLHLLPLPFACALVSDQAGVSAVPYTNVAIAGIEIPRGWTW